VYTTGLFSNASDFDPGAGFFNLTSAGLQEVFVSKLDAAGNFVWAKQMGGSSGDIGESIAVDAAGNVYTIGYFFFTADFDPGAGVFNLTPAGGYDIFVHKMSVCSPPASPTNSTNIINQTLCSGASATLSAVGSGTINWYSTPSSTTSLGSGTNFITPTLTAGTYTYYAEATTCTNSARTQITLTVNVCTGVYSNSSIEDYSVIIYPNPNYGVFKIQIENEIKNGQIILINSIGQNVYEQTVRQGINNINTTELSSGLYNYILLSDKQKIIYGKLVVD
jgi:hypothetical protein